MKLQKLHIKNYKSLVDLEIVEPNPFTVFAGPNGAGKSNIFEALEFGNFLYELNGNSAVRLFGGKESIQNRHKSNHNSEEIGVEIIYYFSDNQYIFKENKDKWNFDLVSENFNSKDYYSSEPNPEYDKKYKIDRLKYLSFSSQYVDSFTRIFIKNINLVRIKEISSEKLSIDCSNLEKVLNRLLENETKREDITEYLELFIPGIERIEIDSNNLSGTDTLLIYEKGINKPFTKDLISDGTYNIICLLTAVFQSNEPQFLCIEEPENGLNPYVVKGMVDLFRNACEERGHYIWLNTHSQTLVEMLRPEELILVNKENGETKITQPKNIDLHGLPTDEAWLSGALGGGVPW